MATSIQIRDIPDTIRAHYDSQHLELVQMAKEAPRRQRNGEDIQLLKFPSTKNILWDHASVGKPHTLHIASYRKPRLCVAEKVLRFAQRHAESTNQTTCVSVLVGTLDVDTDGEGVLFRVERLDPLGDTNTSTSHAAGDMLIPFTLQNGSKQRGSSLEDYSSALQLLQQRCCSKDPVELGNFLLTKGWCSYYIGGDSSLHHLEFDVVAPGVEVHATPIEAVPIVPTALSKNLAGPMSISHMQGVPKTGYLTMDHTRKLLLVLESDPKVTNLPLVGIWVSGVAQAYSPYVWACCLRFLYNSHIQDRVCSPPEPFLLVLYSPTHSKPEFYECAPATGTSTLTFDLYTGYEAVSLAKSVAGSPGAVIDVDMDTVQGGPKQELFDTALAEFSSQQQREESRCSSPDPPSQEDITPRSQPAPHKAKMPMLQSMVPEVSLFFGNGANETCVPNIQNPKPAQPGMNGDVRMENRPPYVRQTGATHQPPPRTSSPPFSVGHTERSVSSATGASHEHVNANTATGALYSSARGYVSSSTPDNINSNPPRFGQPSMAANNVYMGQPTAVSSQYQPRPNSAAHHPTSMLPAPHPTFVPPQPYKNIPHPVNAQPSRFCDCPSCPKPQSGPYPTGQPYGAPHPPAHGQPCIGYRPPPRPPHPGYPPTGQPGGYGGQPYPMQPGELPHLYPPPPMSKPYPGHPPYSHQPGHPSSRTSAGMTANPPLSQSDRYPPTQGIQLPNVAAPQTNVGLQLPNIGNPQTSAGVQLPSAGNRPVAAGSVETPSSLREASGGRPAADVHHSNPNSDNSSRSSDDSGLSFTPEKHNSPGTGSPTVAGGVTGPAAGGLADSGVQWDKVPPEIYDLLLQQDRQLKQLQAQISVLTAERAVPAPSSMGDPPRAAPHTCTMATNTSLAFPSHTQQVSACMQTENYPQRLQSGRNTSPDNSQGRNASHEISHQSGRNASHEVSQSGSSGCETRTPLEIRHRGRRPINSTQRDDGDLDISQGELVAIVNNLHDTTIDSVQSEMIVDIPSFQSSPTRSPRSQESCSDSMFNMSPRSLISASMCETSGQPTTDYSDDEDPRDDTGADNPEYYAKLMDNIKKLLSQNTTEETNLDGYQGDVSSNQSTPVKLAHQDFNLGHELHSFLKFDTTSTKTTDTTFIPKINYVSMFLDSDTDTSLEINAMAMKYLKDEQLTQLTKLQARNRLLKAPRHAAHKTAVLQKILNAEDVDTTQNVSSFGISASDLTFATKKYMERHGLLDGAGTTTSEGSCSESFRLQTNYSTMSSGSDGPAQVTHDVLTTPGDRRRVDELATPTNPHIQPTAFQDTPASQTPYNDSGVSAGYSGTPKPQHVMRRTLDHRRFTPDRNDSHNISVPKSQPHSQNATPFTHNTSAPRQEAVNQFGANRRFASPQITPAVSRPNHSPPENDFVDVPRNFQKELREHNQIMANGDHGNIRTNVVNQYGNNRAVPNETNNASNVRDVPNNFNVRQQFGGREETIDDDRILDITRLKQLPKLL